MWGRAVRAEKQARKQPETYETSNVSRFIATAIIGSAEAREIPVGRNIAVPAKEPTGTLPEIGNDYDVCLVISSAGFQPSFPFTHVIGGSQIRVPVAAPNLLPTEFMYQEEVDHTG